MSRIRSRQGCPACCGLKWNTEGEESASGSVVVRVVEQSVDLRSVLSLAEFAPERVLGQVLEDQLHGLEVLFGAALRAQEQEDRVDGLLVERIEVDPAGGHADGSGHLVDARVLDVRHRNTTPEPGRVFAFALEDFGEEFVADRAICCT